MCISDMLLHSTVQLHFIFQSLVINELTVLWLDNLLNTEGLYFFPNFYTYLFPYIYLIPICKLKLKGYSPVASSFQYTCHTYLKWSDFISLTASVWLKQQIL